MPDGSFKFPLTFESKPFWGNDEEITNATPTITGSGTGSAQQIQLFLGLSATYDGTYTYELVTDATKHTFVATGKWIKWKAVGIDYTITKIEVEVNT